MHFLCNFSPVMRIGSYAGVTIPTPLFSHPQLPQYLHRNLQLNTTTTIRCLGRQPQYASVADCSSSSSTSETSSSPSKTRTRKKPAGGAGGGKSSLYARPSLFEMHEDKVAIRAKVYEFLRGIGIVPDELDGLELPVTADVMKERVDFLHKLGLTIEDINNYPLVLGCSVKKNMIPVLDYLGKLGVRKSTFTHFLRRYPQVLHSSVVVDLAPVVKYLQGMDIKPNDVPRVLEKYPEVLGFKLEGTMSTSVAYLVGIGVARREIGGLLTRYPEILGMRVGRVIKPFVEYLESLGIPRLAVARLIEKRPHILGFGLADLIKPNVEALFEFNVRKEAVASVVAQYPEIIGLNLKVKLHEQVTLLNSVTGLESEDFGRVIERMPQVASLGKSAMLNHVEFLKQCGLSRDQMRVMVVGCPQLLALNIDIMKLSFDFFQEEMDRPLKDLVGFPAFFTYGLESTVKPRHKKVKAKGLKCSLSWVLNCSDERFDQRMEYDTIGMDEMEMPSFDMNTLMDSRSDDSGSDLDDSDDDDYP